MTGTVEQGFHPGVVFDIDGVLLNSNPAHFDSWQDMARKDGFDFSEKLFQDTFGQTSTAILRNHWNRKLTEDEIEEMARRKEDLYREYAARNFDSLIMPGAVGFARDLFAKGFPLSVGSSGPGYNVCFVLERLGIVPLLKGIVSGTDVARGKPAPDIFLQCAEKMRIAPELCVVIDDSESGITAALAAGMKIIGFQSTGHKDEEYRDVDLLVHSFAELSPEALAELFSR